MPPLHLFLLLSICCMWAGNFLVSAWAIQFIEANTYSAVRFLVVLLVALPLLRRPAPGSGWRLLGACWSMGALHFALLFAALGRSTDISSVALLMQIYVPMSTLLAVILLGERIGWRTSAGIGMAFIGVLVMGLDPVILAQLDVVLMVMASAFFLALGTIWMRQIQGVSVLSFQAWNALLSMPLLAVFAWWLESPIETLTAALHMPWVWAAVAFSALGSSLIGHGSFYWLVQRHEVSRVIPFLLLVPLLAVLLGVVFWGDRPSPRLILGGSLVLSGVLWITLRMRYRRQVAVKPAAS